MKFVKRVLLWGGVLVGVILLVGGAAFGCASYRASAVLGEVITAHEIDFAVPMPVDPAALPEDADPDEVALAQAIERGRHLLAARYPCGDCHGENFGGGVMIDDPAMGSLLAPNLTTGAGSVTADYTIADWDRIVRHGIRKDGRPALMPSEDFMAMSDEELSDIIAFIRALPPVDNEVPASTLGPVGKILLATGKFPLSAKMIGDHDAPHLKEPPEAAESVEFGGHLAKVCTGCHRQNFEGGKIVQGPPDWPVAANLTPHEQGLAAYDFEAFETLMRRGIRPDGQPVQMPMTIATNYAANMTDTELRALWMYLRSLPPIPQGR